MKHATILLSLALGICYSSFAQENNPHAIPAAAGTAAPHLRSAGLEALTERCASMQRSPARCVLASERVA